MRKYIVNIQYKYSIQKIFQLLLHNILLIHKLIYVILSLIINFNILRSLHTGCFYEMQNRQFLRNFRKT